MSLVLAGALVITSVFVPGQQTDAKAKVKLNKKKLVLTVGKKAKLKVKGTKKKVKWSSSKKKIATVTKKGVVKAKKKGTAKIVAKIGKKKYTCKVVVKAKKKAKVTSKPKAVAKVTAKPKATAKVTANPGTLPSKNPQVSDNPSQTTQPSEEGDPTTAKIILNDNVATTWNAYHRPLKDVTVTEAATIRIGYTDIFDGSLYYTNTYGREVSLDELKSHEGEEFGQGFWQNHPRNDQSFTLQTGTVNTIYVRLVDNMTETVYYLNSDKIIVQGAAQKTPEPSASATPTATPTPTQTAKPSASPIVTPAPTPSAAPQPSATPTATPTVKPTATPTVKPTATPTVKPTATPTVKPTATPTVKPTATPTVKPTATPTVKPTATPTAKPTATPTAKPTATPTVKPTATPTVKPTATPTVKPTATPTVKPTATPTVKPTATPSGNAGQNVNLNGKKAFTIAGYQLALGLTRDEVNTVLGSLKTDVKRTAKSPQGFDVIAFRAGGNDTDKSFDEKYSTYILIYLKDDIVVGISGNASSMNFDGTVSYGTDAGTLVSNGWVDVDWYKTTAGNAAAYSKDVDNATIIAFADAYGDNRVYSIQIFNNAYSIADMTQCTETTLPMNYSADVLTEMETETFEILNAYLVNTGVRDADVKAIRKNTKVSNVARAYSKEIANKGCIDAANAKRESALSKEALENAGLSFNNWGERIMIGNMDAIGFANSVIESNDARNTLISANYAICGIGASVYTKSAGKAVYYPNMVIDFIDKISTL